MGTQKLLKLEKETIGELKIITAKVNAKSHCRPKVSKKSNFQGLTYCKSVDYENKSV